MVNVITAYRHGYRTRAADNCATWVSAIIQVRFIQRNRGDTRNHWVLAVSDLDIRHWRVSITITIDDGCSDRGVQRLKC